MKEEVKLLRKAQKYLWDLMYPGYPFQISIIVDVEDQVAWIDYGGRKQPLDRALAEVDHHLMYNALENVDVSKRTFIVDQYLPPYKEILEASDDDFYISDINMIKWYFALNSAIYNHKKGDKAFVFASIDTDCDYYDVEVFDSLESIQEYINKYFTDEEDR